MSEFKDIKGYEGAYQINLEGEVKSLERDILTRNHNIVHVKECIRKHTYNTHGVRIIQLSKRSVSKTYFISDLISEAFPK